MPTVYLANSEPPRTSVSLEDVPLVMSTFREEIRELEKEMRKRWPGVSVHIEQQPPRMRNPYVPGAIVHPGHLILVAVWGAYKAGQLSERLRKGKNAFMDAAGKKIGENVGEKISLFMNQWLARREQRLRRNARKRGWK